MRTKKKWEEKEDELENAEEEGVEGRRQNAGEKKCRNGRGMKYAEKEEEMD